MEGVFGTSTALELNLILKHKEAKNIKYLFNDKNEEIMSSKEIIKPYLEMNSELFRKKISTK